VNKLRTNEVEKHFRFEFKYILDSVTYMKVRDFIETLGLDHDENVEGNVYTVTSLYFDSFGNDDYYDKLGGFLNRKKVRARIYGHSLTEDVQNVYLETKYKHNMYIQKKRVTISPESWKSFMIGGNKLLSNEFGKNIMEEGRVPVCVVRYEREAFVEQFFSRVRLTFDRNIEAERNEDLEYKDNKLYDTVSVLDSGAIMEIKFNNRLPWWFGFMVKEFDLRRDAYSKYAHARDALSRYKPFPK